MELIHQVVDLTLQPQPLLSATRTAGARISARRTTTKPAAQIITISVAELLGSAWQPDGRALNLQGVLQVTTGKMSYSGILLPGLVKRAKPQGASVRENGGIPTGRLCIYDGDTDRLVPEDFEYPEASDLPSLPLTTAAGDEDDWIYLDAAE